MLGIALLLFAMLEGILRLLYPGRVAMEQQQNAESPAFEFDPDALIRLKSNVKKGYQMSMENGGEIVWWQTNSDGFRGAELEEAPDFRIMLYGDSNIQGRFSTLEKTFVYQLQENLRAITEKKIEVINAGIVGAGPDQYLIRFKQHFEKYRPDLVIFHITCDNDFGDILRNRLFDFGEGNMMRSKHERRVDEHLLEIEVRKNSWKAKINSLLIVKAGNKLLSRIIQKEQVDLINLYLELAEKEHQNYLNKTPKNVSHFGDHFEVDMAIFPNAEASKLKKKAMAIVFENAQEFAAKNQIPFFVTIQPSIVDATTNAAFSYEDLEGYEQYHRANMTNAVEQICVDLQIPNVNLFPTFLENDPNSLYLKVNDDHWNDKGQALAARIVGKALQNHILESADSSLSQ